ncbi:MAG: nucleoside triphosphate pyrophosphohydrolase [Rickettsiales bacterium]|nr:nucleoside triphosphate pyrophosphohydrolase [Rickettsiales bacterium]
MKHLLQLLEVMETLRDPLKGCPWDIEQTFSSLTPYIIEEAYELVDAIENGTADNILEEAGDLLLQVVFIAQIAKEQSLFEFDDAASVIAEKLVRRHPHVFGPDASRISVEEQQKVWHDIKASEQNTKQKSNSILDGIPLNHSALTRAAKIQQKASKVGFDWDDINDLFAKLYEEVDEFKQATNKQDSANMEEELGDMLFTIAHIANRYNIDPEKALRRTNKKFCTRFNYIESELEKENLTPVKASLKKMDHLWEQAKEKEYSS